MTPQSGGLLTDSDPVEPIHDAELVEPRPAGRDAYNIVSDTVTGVNIRPRDNLIQALAIAVCLLLGVAIGALVLQFTIEGTPKVVLTQFHSWTNPVRCPVTT